MIFVAFLRIICGSNLRMIVTSSPVLRRMLQLTSCFGRVIAELPQCAPVRTRTRQCAESLEDKARSHADGFLHGNLATFRALNGKEARKTKFFGRRKRISVTTPS
jgi:hypothetical protein